MDNERLRYYRLQALRGNSFAQKVVDAFNPDQPRDPDGKWGSGGATGKAKVEAGLAHAMGKMTEGHAAIPSGPKQARAFGQRGLTQGKQLISTAAAQAHREAAAEHKEMEYRGNRPGAIQGEHIKAAAAHERAAASRDPYESHAAWQGTERMGKGGRLR